MTDLDEPFDPYEGVVIAKPISPRPGGWGRDALKQGKKNEWEDLVIPLTFGQARIATRLIDRPLSYEELWCYKSIPAAVAALAAWSGEGEPEGWHRHLTTGRRRPGGDPTKEYVRE